MHCQGRPLARSHTGCSSSIAAAAPFSRVFVQDRRAGIYSPVFAVYLDRLLDARLDGLVRNELEERTLLAQMLVSSDEEGAR